MMASIQQLRTWIVGITGLALIVISAPLEAQHLPPIQRQPYQPLWTVFGVDPYQRSYVPQYQKQVGQNYRLNQSAPFEIQSTPSSEIWIDPTIYGDTGAQSYSPGSFDPNCYESGAAVAPGFQSDYPSIPTYPYPAQAQSIPFTIEPSLEPAVDTIPEMPSEVIIGETVVEVANETHGLNPESSPSDIIVESPNSVAPTPAKSKMVDSISTSDLAELKTDLARSEQQHAKAVQRARSSEERAFATERNNKAKQQSSAKKITELKKQVSALEKKLASSVKEAGTKKLQMQEADASVQAIEAERDLAAKREAELKKSHGNAINKLTKTETEYSEAMQAAQEKINQLTDEKVDAANQIAKLKTKMEMSSKKIDAAEKKIQNELAAGEANLKQAKSKLIKEKTELAKSLKQQAATATKNDAALKQALKNAYANTRTAEDARRLAELNLRKLKSKHEKDLETLAKRAEVAEQEIAEHKASEKKAVKAARDAERMSAEAAKSASKRAAMEKDKAKNEKAAKEKAAKEKAAKEKAAKEKATKDNADRPENKSNLDPDRTVYNQIKQLMTQQDSQLKSSAAKIRARFNIRIKKLIADGKKESSSEVKSLNKKMAEQLKKNDTKVRSNYKKKMDAIRRAADEKSQKSQSSKKK